MRIEMDAIFLVVATLPPCTIKTHLFQLCLSHWPCTMLHAQTRGTCTAYILMYPFALHFSAASSVSDSSIFANKSQNGLRLAIKLLVPFTPFTFRISRYDEIQKWTNYFISVWNWTHRGIRRWLIRNTRLDIDRTAIQLHPFCTDIGHSLYRNSSQVNRLNCNRMGHSPG